MIFLSEMGGTKGSQVPSGCNALELGATSEEVEEELKKGAQGGEEGVHVNNMDQMVVQVCRQHLQGSSLQVSSFNNYNSARGQVRMVVRMSSSVRRGLVAYYHHIQQL